VQYFVARRDPKQIRRDVRGVVFCVAAFILTLNIVAVVVVMAIIVIENADSIMHIVNSVEGDSTEVLTNFLLSAYSDAINTYLGLGMIIGMICGLPWFFIIRGKRFLTTDVARINSKAGLGTILILLLCVFGIQGFMSLILIVLEPLFNQGGGSLTDVLEESTSSLAITFWGALYIIVIGPICEELVFRGGVMRKLERYGANFAIIVSSLLFALYHMILFQAMFAFFIGIILAYTAGRFSLKWAILLHMINNGLAILPTLVDSEFLAGVLFIIYIASFLAAGIVLFICNNFLTAQKAAGAPSEPKVFARAFTSPWLIGYIVLTGFAAVALVFA